MSKRVDSFIQNVKCQLGQVHRLPSMNRAPALVMELAEKLNVPARAVAAADADIEGMDWRGIEVEYRPARIEDVLGISRALAGIAETGTVVFISDKNHPPSLNFIPEFSFVILQENEIVPVPEDVWALLKKRGPMPSTLNLVTGPSRTGDIEQTLFLGAHGPRELHVLLVKA